MKIKKEESFILCKTKYFKEYVETGLDENFHFDS